MLQAGSILTAICNILSTIYSVQGAICIFNVQYTSIYYMPSAIYFMQHAMVKGLMFYVVIVALMQFGDCFLHISSSWVKMMLYTK